MKYLLVFIVLGSFLSACSSIQILDPCAGKKFPKKQWCEFKEKYKDTKDRLH